MRHLACFKPPRVLSVFFDAVERPPRERKDLQKWQEAGRLLGAVADDSDRQSKENAGPITVKVTVRIGVSHAAHVQKDGPEKLLAAADMALYAAKECGRNAVRVQRLPEYSEPSDLSVEEV
jgi:GGDEF domain-containing protein